MSLALGEVGADCVEVLDGPVNSVRHDHGAGLTTDLVKRDDLLVEVVDHDLPLHADSVLVPFHVLAQLLVRPADVELGIALHSLHKPVVAADGRIGLQHIEDEALLDGLLHRVAVERAVFRSPVLREGFAEELQGLVFLGVAVNAK